MSNPRNWRPVSKAVPCPKCGRPDWCRLSLDGEIAWCGRTAEGAFKESGGGYLHRLAVAAHSFTPTTPAPPPRLPKAYPNAQAAVKAAAQSVRGRLAATWTYRSAAGSEAFRVLRFERAGGGGKQYRPLHRAADSLWRLCDPPGLLPLYRLDELPPDGPVWVAEGEKAADAARQIGLAATTSAHGAACAAKTDWSALAGRTVYLLPDNDEPGGRYAADVAALLGALDPPAVVRVVDLPGLPGKGDIVDYLEARPGVLPEDLRQQVEALAAAAPVRAAATGGSVKPEQCWPDPRPLPDGLPPVEPFDYGLLPTSLHGWVADIAERMQCPPDYVAATAMVVAAALLGRRVAIRPKRHDDWQVVPNLFGAMVGRPSLMKSPAMKEVLRLSNRLEVEAKVRFAKELAEHEAATVLAKATKQVRQSELKQAIKDGGDARAILDQITEADAADAEPVRRRYVVHDTTVEKLGIILAENPDGALVFADELISLLRSMDREGHEADRGFYLTAWAGDSRYSYDRVGRGTLDIEAAIVSVVGSIQPGVIAEYLRQAVRGGSGDDGLVQRFQMTVWPDPPVKFRNVDRRPDAAAKAAADAALTRLATLTPGDAHAERDNSCPEMMPFLRFEPHEAQPAFDAWREDLERRVRAPDLHPALESHLAKYRSLVPSLALVLHLLDGGAGSVPLAAVERAVRWSRYMESHARRLYACVTDSPAVAARALARRILDGSVAGTFAARDVYRMGWSGLGRDDTDLAIDVLLSLGWLDERVEPTRGRDGTRYVVNPKVFTATGAELTELTEGPCVGSVSGPPEASDVFEAEPEPEPEPALVSAGAPSGEVWGEI